MDNSRKRMFAAFAVMAFTLCMFAGVSMMDDDSEVDAASGSAISGSVGQYLEVKIAARNAMSSANMNGWQFTHDLPAGLNVEGRYNGSVGAAVRGEIWVYGTPTEGATGTYTVTWSISGSSTVDYTGSINITGGSKTFTLNYNANGGSGAPSAQTYTGTGSSHTFTISSTEPTRNGYSFEGWSTSSSGSATYQPGGRISVTGTTTLYAVWEKNDTPVTSITVSASGEGDYVTLTANVSPSSASNKNVTWSVYSGSGDVRLSSTTGSSIRVYPEGNGSVTIRATAQDGSGRYGSDTLYVFEMAFNANGGSGAPSSVLYIDYNSSSNRLEIPSGEPYRSGWEFMGWSTSSSGSPSYDPGDTYSVSYSSVRNMYAIWGDYGYLQFNRNGGSGSVPSTQSVLIAEDDYEYITIPSSPTPTMSGMEFVGWCTNQSGSGTIYDPGDSVDVDCGATVTLYAIYEDPYVDYTLTYDANGGYGAPSADYGRSATGTCTFTLDASTIPTNGDFTFLGWSESRDGSTTIYQPGGTYSTNRTSQTLYAVWQASYTLTYVGGPGSANVPSTQSHEAVSTSPYSFTVSSQVPTLTGSVFKGWDTSSQASTPVYQPGATVSVGCNETVTLYAVWEAANIEITSVQNGGTFFVGQEFSYTVLTNISGCTISVSGADWLSVNGNVVSGTANATGTFTVTVTASLDGYTSDTQQFTITVYSALGFDSDPEASGIYAYIED